MKIIIILLLSIKVAYFFELNLNNSINKGFIANGKIYDAKKYPYVVTFITTEDVGDNNIKEFTCTGALIKKLYVLTAAHCIHNSNKTNIKVFLGSRLNNIFQMVAELYVPKYYKELGNKEDNVMSGDIGLIKLKHSFPEAKKYIQIGGKPKDFENQTVLKCTSIGFGVKENEEMGVEGRMITTDVTHGPTACKGHEKDLIKLHWKEYLCSASGRPTMICPGDSGGPIICNDKLYGVASFIFNFKYGDSTCGGPDMQTVHTFINYHLKWVNSIIDLNEKKKKKKNSGNLLKPRLTLHTIITILLYSVLTIILK